MSRFRSRRVALAVLALVLGGVFTAPPVIARGLPTVITPPSPPAPPPPPDGLSA